MKPHRALLEHIGDLVPDGAKNNVCSRAMTFAQQGASTREAAKAAVKEYHDHNRRGQSLHGRKAGLSYER